MALDRVGLRRRRSDELQASCASTVDHEAKAEELIQDRSRNGEGRGHDADHLQDAYQFAHEIKQGRRST